MFLGSCWSRALGVWTLVGRRIANDMGYGHTARERCMDRFAS